MPQQQPTENKREKEQKLSKIPFICIVIFLIAVVITVCLVVKNNKSNKEEKQGSGSSANSQQQQEKNQDVQENIPVAEQSLIDMNNTENAKVENGTKQNTSPKLAEQKTYKGLIIKDIKLIAEGGITRLTATIENSTGQNYVGEGVTIVFTNKDGLEYAKLKTMLPSTKNGDTNELDAGTTADIANAYDFTIQ